MHDGSDREPDYELALVKGETLRPEGKNSILCALKAHAIIDDRQDVLNGCFYAGVRCFKSEGKRDRELTYLALVEDWIRQEGVQSIALQHHFGTAWSWRRVKSNCSTCRRRRSRRDMRPFACSSTLYNYIQIIHTYIYITVIYVPFYPYKIAITITFYPYKIAITSHDLQFYPVTVLALNTYNLLTYFI